jgi:hypothetical protein
MQGKQNKSFLHSNMNRSEDHYYEPEEANSNSLYNSLLAAPSKVAEQNSCTVNLPAQGSRERVTNTQKHRRRRRRRRSSGENKNKTRLLKHTEKKDRKAQERLNLDLRKPPHKKIKRKKESLQRQEEIQKNTELHYNIKERKMPLQARKSTQRKIP